MESYCVRDGSPGRSGPINRLTSAADARINGPAVHLDKPQLTEIAEQAETGRIVPAIANVRDHDQIRESHTGRWRTVTYPASSSCPW